MTLTEFYYHISIIAFAISIVSMVCIFAIIVYQKFVKKRQAGLTLEQYIYGLTLHLKKRFGTKKRWCFCKKHEEKN